MSEYHRDSYREERSLRGPLAIGHLVRVFEHRSTWRVTRLDRERGVAEAENLNHKGVRVTASLKLLRKV